MRATSRLWRVFPWDPDADDGAPFSPTFVPDPTGRGRFDLPSRLSRVIYLAETPAHAVAEMIQPWRGRAIDDRHLTRAGRRLAVVEVTGSLSATTLVVFTARTDAPGARLAFGEPALLDIDSAAVEEAADALGISLAAPRP